jgi:hypothetical protein
MTADSAAGYGSPALIERRYSCSIQGIDFTAQTRRMNYFAKKFVLFERSKRGTEYGD